MKVATNSVEKRLRILGDDEIEALYGRPQFTPEEREQYTAAATDPSLAGRQGLQQTDLCLPRTLSSTSYD